MANVSGISNVRLFKLCRIILAPLEVPGLAGSLPFVVRGRLIFGRRTDHLHNPIRRCRQTTLDDKLIPSAVCLIPTG